MSDRTPVICMLMASRDQWHTHVYEVPKPDFPYKSDMVVIHTVSWDAKFQYIVPLDRWERMTSQPCTLVSIGSLPSYMMEHQGEYVRVILDPPPMDMAWVLRPEETPIDPRVPYETVELPKRSFCWDSQGRRDKSYELNFCAGGAELTALLRCSAFHPVYRRGGGVR